MHIAHRYFFMGLLLSTIEIPTTYLSKIQPKRYTYCIFAQRYRYVLLLTNHVTLWRNVVILLDAVILNVLLYLIGKFSITISFVILYMYTAEMFPTEIRHSLLGICSMFGRIGSMVAPQTPLLVSIGTYVLLNIYPGALDVIKHGNII